MMATTAKDESFAATRVACRNWSRWGAEDELGTLNLITPTVRLRAAAEINHGIAICLSRPLAPADDAFGRTQRQMVRLPDDPPIGPNAPQFVIDTWVHSHHGECHTHMDSVAHVSYQGQMYNGRDPASSVTNVDGARYGAISAMKDGIFTRGILFDIPTAVGKDWLAAGHAITAAELKAAAAVQKVEVVEGDAVLIRTGVLAERVATRSAETASAGCAGLAPSAIQLLHEWGVSLIGTDTHGEAVPAIVPEMAFPLHVLALIDMGMPILDNADFEKLAIICGEKGRFTFAFSLQPLQYVGGTGSPVNPVALV